MIPKWVLVVDLDKCLLNHEGRVTAENRKALSFAYTTGALVILATGRMWPAVASIAQEIPGVRAAVTLNGAVVIDAISTEVLTNVCLSSADVASILMWCEESGLQAMFCGDDRVDATRADAVLEAYVRRTGIAANLLTSEAAIREPIYKAIVYQEIDWTDEEALAALAMSKPTLRHLTTYKTDHGYIELCPPNISKDSAVAKLLMQWQLDHLPLVTVGDGENDIGLLLMTEFSYAVGNACVGAKAAARTIVANCDQNGVADAISDFVANHLHELRGEEDGVA